MQHKILPQSIFFIYRATSLSQTLPAIRSGTLL